MKKLIPVLIFLVILLTVQLVNAQGLKVLPAMIRLSNLARDEQFSVTIRAYNPDNVEETFSILVDNKISGWVTFYYPEDLNSQISQITIPAMSSRNVIAIFRVPKDAPNGLYLSTIYIGGSGGSQAENTSSLSIKIPISVSLEVAGSQILSGKVINITAADTEMNRILRIETEFQNTGEIIAAPVIEVSIKKNDVEIVNFVANATSVNVGNTSIIDAEWDTTGQTVGDYVATVDVYLNNSLIKESNLKFKILERGTLTAEGKIVNISSPKTADSGSVSKIEVEFMNTGEIDVNARISGEVYSDNKLVDTLQGDETLVKVGKTETLTAYFRPTKEGLYSIKSDVVYEGKKEPLSDISINVVGSTTTGMAVTSSGIFDLLSNNIVIIAVVIITAIIIVVIYFKKFRDTY